MSVDREYKIRIQTITEGDAGKTADDLKKVGKEAEGAGEGFKLLETHGGEFRKLIHELDEALPGFGTALKVAVNPASIGITSLVVGIELAKNALEAYKKKLEDMIAAAEKADFAESFDAATEAAKSAKDAAEDYRQKLEEIQKGEHGVTAELAARLQIIAAIQAAQQSQADAEKTMALAKLKEQEALGQVSESDAIIRRGEIEKKNIADKAQAEEENFAKQQQARNAALDEAAQKQAGLEQSAAEATAKVNAAKEAQAHAKGAPTRDNVKKAIEEADEAQALFQSNWDIPVDIGTQLPADASEASRMQQEEARQKRQQAALLQAQFNQAQRANSVDVEALQAEATRKQNAAVDNLKAVASIRDEMNAAGRTQTDPNVTGAKAAADRAGTGTVDANTHVELMTRARGLQKEFQSQGAGMPAADMKELLQLIRMLGEKFFEQGQDKVTQQQLKQEIAGLRRLIETKGK